jgi:hypothetical protein
MFIVLVVTVNWLAFTSSPPILLLCALTVLVTSRTTAVESKTESNRVRIKGALNDVAAISATTAKVKGDLGKLTTIFFHNINPILEFSYICHIRIYVPRVCY